MPIIRSITDIKCLLATCQTSTSPCSCFESDETFVSMGSLLDHLHFENKSACKTSVSSALADLMETATHKCHALSYLVLRTQMKGTEGARIFAQHFTADKMHLLETLTHDDRGVAISLWSGYMLMYAQNVLPAAFESKAALFIVRHYETLGARLTSQRDDRTLYGGLGVLLLILIRNELARKHVFSLFPKSSEIWKDIRSSGHPTLTRYLDQLSL